MIHLKNGIAICTPIPAIRSKAGNITTAPVTIEWARSRYSLMMPTNFNTVEFFIDMQEVGVARNIAVKKAQEHNAEFLFFLDYDVIVSYDAVAKLHFLARKYTDYDVFAGLYCCKSESPEPLVYKGDYGLGPYWDWTLNDIIFDVSGIHMGMTLIRMSLFDKLPEGKLGWFHTPDGVEQTPDGQKLSRGTEDLYFCKRAINEVNAKILCDTSLLAPHVDNSTGIRYGLRSDSPPVERAYFLKTKDKKEKLAIDIGAGENKLNREGYKVYGTDIRNGVTDHCCHSLQLNLPDDYYDLVYSSHHFEHFDRTEQKALWEQAYRVCKPDGLIEIVVPNVRWAAKKIAIDCELDEHCLNVLHGAGSLHNYERQYNTHYFSYTKEIAKAFAEATGFIDVTVEDWEDRDELGYNLVLKGRKPNGSDHKHDKAGKITGSKVHDNRGIKQSIAKDKPTGKGKSRSVKPVRGNRRGKQKAKE